MRRFLAITFLGLAMASPSYADLISTATVNVFGPCGSSTETMGTSSAYASACTAPEGGTASTSINFIVTPTTLATWIFNDAGGQSTTGESSALFDNQLVVTGGSGAGFLSLNFVETGVLGNNDPQGSAYFNVLASLNGVQYSDVRICGNPPATEGIVCMNPMDPIGAAFTYGVPFELSVELDAVAAGGLAHLVPYTTIGGHGALDYSLPSGSEIQTVGQSVVPEPASTILMSSGIFVLFLRQAVLRRAVPSHKTKLSRTLRSRTDLSTALTRHPQQSTAL